MAKAKSKKSQKKKEIEIHYIKTPSYKTYHVDGAYGGLNARGNLYCEFYVDRNVTPKVAVYEIEKDGRLGKVKKKIGKDGMVRQIECGMSLDMEAARALKDWLDQKIKEYDETKKLFDKG